MNDFENRLVALRTRFRARLAEDLEWMEQIATGLPRAPDLIELQSRAHKLVGLSGSLGFPEVARAAKPLDREWSANVEQMDEVRALLATLREVCK